MIELRDRFGAPYYMPYAGAAPAGLHVPLMDELFVWSDTAAAGNIVAYGPHLHIRPLEQINGGEAFPTEWLPIFQPGRWILPGDAAFSASPLPTIWARVIYRMRSVWLQLPAPSTGQVGGSVLGLSSTYNNWCDAIQELMPEGAAISVFMRTNYNGVPHIFPLGWGLINPRPHELKQSDISPADLATFILVPGETASKVAAFSIAAGESVAMELTLSFESGYDPAVAEIAAVVVTDTADNILAVSDAITTYGEEVIPDQGNLVVELAPTQVGVAANRIAVCVDTAQQYAYAFGGLPTATAGGQFLRFDVTNNFAVEALPDITPGAAKASYAQMCEFDGYVYVVGGLSNSNVVLQLVNRYNVAAGTWQVMNPTGQARHAGHLVRVRGDLWLIGGSATNSAYNSVATVQKYIPATDSWESHTTACVSGGGSSIMQFGDEIYMVGGWRTPTAVWKFDFAPYYTSGLAPTCAQVASLPAGVSNTGILRVGDGETGYLIGGSTSAVRCRPRQNQYTAVPTASLIDPPYATTYLTAPGSVAYQVGGLWHSLLVGGTGAMGTVATILHAYERRLLKGFETTDMVEVRWNNKVLDSALHALKILSFASATIVALPVIEIDEVDYIDVNYLAQLVRATPKYLFNTKPGNTVAVQQFMLVACQSLSLYSLTPDYGTYVKTAAAVPPVRVRLAASDYAAAELSLDGEQFFPYLDLTLLEDTKIYVRLRALGSIPAAATHSAKLVAEVI